MFYAENQSTKKEQGKDFIRKTLSTLFTSILPPTYPLINKYDRYAFFGHSRVLCCHDTKSTPLMVYIRQHYILASNSNKIVLSRFYSNHQFRVILSSIKQNIQPWH